MKPSGSDHIGPESRGIRLLLWGNRTVSYIRRNPNWGAVFLITISALSLFSAVEAPLENDIRLYEGVGNSLAAGRMPYRDLDLAYPPYAIPIFVLPWLFRDGLHFITYPLAFAGLVMLADSTTKCLLLLEGSRHQDRFLGLVPLALYSLSVPFIRFFYLQRYDVFPSLIVTAAICSFARGHFGLSGAVLAIGAGVKLYPALLAPALWVLAVRQQHGVRFLSGFVAALIPLALLSLFLPWGRFLGAHSERGIQVESLYASIIWMGHLLGLAEARWTPLEACTELHGPLAQGILPLAKGLVTFTTLTSLISAAWFGSRCRILTVYQIARLMLVPLLPFVVFNIVFSPQYMIWLLPLAALGILGGRKWPMLVIILANAVIPVFYPSPQYATGLNLAQTIVLTLRNLALAAVWLALLKEFWDMRDEETHNLDRKP